MDKSLIAALMLVLLLPLAACDGGDGNSEDALFAASCGELRKLANRRLRDGGRNTGL